MIAQMLDYSIDQVVEIDTSEIVATYRSGTPGRIFLENADGIFFEVSEELYLMFC